MVAVSGYQRCRGMVMVGGWRCGGVWFWCGRTWQTPYCSAPVRARLPASVMTSPFLTLLKFKSYMNLCGTMWHSVITPNYSASASPKEKLSLPYVQRSLWGHTSPAVMGTVRKSQWVWTSPPQHLTFASMSEVYLMYIKQISYLEEWGRLLTVLQLTWQEAWPFMVRWPGQLSPFKCDVCKVADARQHTVNGQRQAEERLKFSTKQKEPAP